MKKLTCWITKNQKYMKKFQHSLENINIKGKNYDFFLNTKIKDLNKYEDEFGKAETFIDYENEYFEINNIENQNLINIDYEIINNNNLNFDFDNYDSTSSNINKEYELDLSLENDIFCKTQDLKQVSEKLVDLRELEKTKSLYLCNIDNKSCKQSNLKAEYNLDKNDLLNEINDIKFKIKRYENLIKEITNSINVMNSMKVKISTYTYQFY
jgi:hypothetical protein